MSLATIHSRACLGIDAPAVQVEVHLANGMPSLTLVGLPETAVRESKDRVRSALLNAQLEFPGSKRITISLAPADLPKDGGRFDLAIALGLLAASGQIPAQALTDCESIGELALSGELGISTKLGGDALSITPRASMRGAYISWSNVAESGGDAGLMIDRKSANSLQGRVGATIKSEMGGIKPFLTVNYAHEFEKQPAFFTANLVGGTGPNVPFTLGVTDKDWGEVGGGLTFTTGSVDISLSADTTLWRNDIKYQSYRASAKFRF